MRSRTVTHSERIVAGLSPEQLLAPLAWGRIVGIKNPGGNRDLHRERHFAAQMYRLYMSAPYMSNHAVRDSDGVFVF